MAMTHDYTYAYRGIWTDGGVCRIQIFEGHDRPPVIVATELPENTNTSVTNLAEYLAAEVLRRHFPQRFEEPEPAIWIERYPRPAEPWLRRVVGNTEYSRVTFATWIPRAVFRGGVRRLAIGQPTWTHLEPADVRRLLGRLPDEADTHG